MLRSFLNQKWIMFFLFQILCHACGESEVSINTTLLNYGLESEATNEPFNKLVFIAPPGSEYQIKIISDDVFGNFTSGESFSMPSELEVFTGGYGEYDIRVVVTQADGTIFIDDVLKWEYFDIDPDDPIVSFSEIATNDSGVQLLISTSRGPRTNEIWVEGDLAESESPEGSWREIPHSDQVPIILTEEDGIKAIRVKLRNDFGNESILYEMKIIKKSIIPTNCFAIPYTFKVRKNEIIFKAEGNNNGSLIVNLYGDVENGFKELVFLNSKKFKVQLSDGEGVKKNYCFSEG